MSLFGFFGRQPSQGKQVREDARGDVDFQLVEDLQRGGTARAFIRLRTRGTHDWTTTALEITVHDAMEMFEGETGKHGWAVWSTSAACWCVRQMQCGS